MKFMIWSWPWNCWTGFWGFLLCQTDVIKSQKNRKRNNTTAVKKLCNSVCKRDEGRHHQAIERFRLHQGPWSRCCLLVSFWNDFSCELNRNVSFQMFTWVCWCLSADYVVVLHWCTVCNWGQVKVENCGDTSDGVSIVPVTARVAVGVQPVLHVGLLSPLIQSLHVEQMLLRGGESDKMKVEVLTNIETTQERHLPHLHKCMRLTQNHLVLCFKCLHSSATAQ